MISSARSTPLAALGALLLLPLAGPATADDGATPLVDKVRTATAQYRDINVAFHEGWVTATPCVSGPNTGAMGVHLLLPSRLVPTLNPADPQLLIYEPMEDGRMRLVGTEFIVLADAWARAHPSGPPPALDGNLLNYVDAPNRYGLPAFYEIHVWAWERNPQGSYADWNTHVTCVHQPG